MISYKLGSEKLGDGDLKMDRKIFFRILYLNLKENRYRNYAPYFGQPKFLNCGKFERFQFLKKYSGQKTTNQNFRPQVSYCYKLATSKGVARKNFRGGNQPLATPL